MKLSRAFTEHIGLVTPRLRAVFDTMDLEGYTFTMAMFGEVAFAIMERSRSLEAATLLEKRFPGSEPFVVGIDETGARITATNR
jgi:pantoate kinase